MADRRRSSPWLKAVIGIVFVAVIGYLFVQSLETTRAEPYTLDRAQLGRWELTLEPGGGPNAPLLALQTDIGLVSNLFRQVFLRTMESMNTPPRSSMPIVLQGEFAQALAGRMSPEQLLQAARDADLESGPHEPRCLVYRRVSEPGSTRQVYAMLMSSPSTERFRARLASESGGALEAGAQPPILFVGSSEPDFDRWLPWAVTEADCVAPVDITG